MVALWGVATTCMAVTDSFVTLAVCRFFLSAFETCITPILTILVGQYYTTREQPLRACIWWACGGVGGFVADSITYAVSGGAWADSKYETWQVCRRKVEPNILSAAFMLTSDRSSFSSSAR